MVSIDKSKIMKWYRFGIWTKEQVANAVEKHAISAEDYEYITGEVYEGSKG